ncbi:MAG: hypothetical protein CVV21_10605 [Candidatus Goldiibacteriota bacterium HGW-Goldbacteria-1]|jgi:uncharacterized repeat protein (TIGR01451 family)|nr:MAG: hypothetical protein CVV21_10605 [Candidatus Goldiibacteriota bacterium HGW-Goldbacteria-1]
MNIKRFFLTASISLLFAFSVSAACNPTAATLCVAVDDIADVWINGQYIDAFTYVNWDETGVQPKCVTFNPDILDETQNIVAIKVKNLRCCEVWGSWSIEATCSDGTHSCINSDATGASQMRLNFIEDCTQEPAYDSLGNTWWAREYQDAGVAPWQNPEVVTGTIYGKIIYDPCTGQRLQPLSYDANSGAETDDCKHLYMRQEFIMTPIPTLPPASFTIAKSVTPTSGITTNDVSYTLEICNSGNYTTSTVEVYDDFDPGFGFAGPYGGGCDAYGDGSPCFTGDGSSFSIRWLRGFPGQTCVTITAVVKDYYFDRSQESCDYRDNVAGVKWPSPVDWARSNTVTVQMECIPTNTPSATFTRTNTFTHTYTRTFTNTFTLTHTRTNVYTPTFTLTHTNSFTATNTFTRTITPTFTNSMTYTPTNTATFTPTNTFTASNTYTPGGPTDTPSNTHTNTHTFTRTNTFTHTFTNTRTFTNTHTATATHTSTYTFTNTHTATDTATHTATSTETFTATDTATATHTPYDRVSLHKSVSQTEALIGDTLQYCITFTNVGAVVTDLVIWDTIPYEVDFLFCQGSVCSTYPATVNGLPTTVVQWEINGIEVGVSGSVCFLVRVARFPVITYGENNDIYAYFESKKREIFYDKPVPIRLQSAVSGSGLINSRAGPPGG